MEGGRQQVSDTSTGPPLSFSLGLTICLSERKGGLGWVTDGREGGRKQQAGSEGQPSRARAAQQRRVPRGRLGRNRLSSCESALQKPDGRPRSGQGSTKFVSEGPLLELREVGGGLRAPGQCSPSSAGPSRASARTEGQEAPGASFRQQQQQQQTSTSTIASSRPSQQSFLSRRPTRALVRSKNRSSSLVPPDHPFSRPRHSARRLPFVSHAPLWMTPSAADAAPSSSSSSFSYPPKPASSFPRARAAAVSAVSSSESMLPSAAAPPTGPRMPTLLAQDDILERGSGSSAGRPVELVSSLRGSDEKSALGGGGGASAADGNLHRRAAGNGNGNGVDEDGDALAPLPSSSSSAKATPQRRMQAMRTNSKNPRIFSSSLAEKDGAAGGADDGDSEGEAKDWLSKVILSGRDRRSFLLLILLCASRCYLLCSALPHAERLCGRPSLGSSALSRHTLIPFPLQLASDRHASRRSDRPDVWHAALPAQAEAVVLAARPPLALDLPLFAQAALVAHRRQLVLG